MSYQYLPIFPHLLDLLHAAELRGIRPILIGGLGLYIRRSEILRTGVVRMRNDVLPEARATGDIDALIQLVDLGDADKRTALRALLCEDLVYEPSPSARYFQFKKEVLHGRSGQTIEVKIDLHARVPRSDEPVRSKPSDTRVPSDCKILQGRKTREAFAAEVKPWPVTLTGSRSDGQSCTTTVLLPHPFAATIMKLKAALDHMRTPSERRVSKNAKHAFDVYLLLSLMTEAEWNESLAFTQVYREEAELQTVRSALVELFGSDTAQGSQDVLSTHLQGGGSRGEIDLEWMRGLLTELLGS